MGVTLTWRLCGPRDVSGSWEVPTIDCSSVSCTDSMFSKSRYQAPPPERLTQYLHVGLQKLPRVTDGPGWDPEACAPQDIRKMIHWNCRKKPLQFQLHFILLKFSLMFDNRNKMVAAKYGYMLYK